MKAVFRLIKDFLGVLLKDFCGDLLFPMGGQAVLYHGVRLCHRHNSAVDLVFALELMKVKI